jgi:hypothetical protein
MESQNSQNIDIYNDTDDSDEGGAGVSEAASPKRQALRSNGSGLIKEDDDDAYAQNICDLTRP